MDIVEPENRSIFQRVCIFGRYIVKSHQLGCSNVF